MNNILNAKTIGGLLLAVLMLLIFSSKTIYNYNLPEVTATSPKNGRLSKLEISKGTAVFAGVERLYAALDGVVEAMPVSEGDTVTEGQELFRLNFDREEAERRLKELQNSRSKLYTDIQSINLKLDKANRYMEDLQNEVYSKDEVSSHELDLIRLEIRKARAELTDVRDRYEDGDADEIELNRARLNLQSLFLKEEEAERKIDEQKEKSAESIEEQEKSRESKLKDYESDIAALKLDLQSKNLDISNLALQEETYKKALEDFEAYAVITAPASGTIISLEVQAGEAIRENQLIAQIGAGSEFKIECAISKDNNFVIPGDTCELVNASRVINGSVTKLMPSAEGKTVTISFTSTEASFGETFDVTFSKDSETTYTLIPNGALNQDNDGYFINQVKRRDGILGKEYYLERVTVYIGDSDNSNTAIVRGITFFEPIALLSDKPVSSGDIIFLKNAGDFFEE